MAGVMAIDVLDYAILGNHLHVVLRNRPDIVSTWSDAEVARRWWFVCPSRKNADGSVPNPLPCEIGLLLQDVDEYRSRLSDISWMMRLACQPIARRANQEDDVDGRFFAKRFDCERLETSADLLSCSVYVDLNVIRAGMAETPEESEFTSAFDRIRARWQRTQEEMGTSVSLPSQEEAVVLCELLQRTQRPSWVSFSCRDGKHLADGTLLADAASLFAKHPQVHAIGVNCVAPEIVVPLIRELRGAAPQKSIVVYPNSGEVYNADNNSWSGTVSELQCEDSAQLWIEAGATLVGGCCRIGPSQIAAMGLCEALGTVE